MEIEKLASLSECYEGGVFWGTINEKETFLKTLLTLHNYSALQFGDDGALYVVPELA